MRCKNCKTKIENPSLYRCPKCGKPLPKKKEINKGDLAVSIGFSVVSILFIVLGILSLSFHCDYYTSAVVIVAVIAYVVMVPFNFGGFNGMSAKATQICAAVTSVPFIVNLLSVFIGKQAIVDYGGLSTAYFVYVLAVMVLGDLLLVLTASGVVNFKKVASFIMLGLCVVTCVFTVVAFVTDYVIKGFAVAIVMFNSVTPTYLAFHTLIKDSRSVA